MKKQYLALLILPALMLTSCSKGKEIKKEEAEKLAQEINDKNEASEDTSRNVELSFSMNEVSGRGEDKESIKVEYTVKTNEDGESYFQMKGGADGENYDFTLITAKVEEYGEVTYLKTYDAESKKTTQYSFAGDTTLYSAMLLEYQAQMMIPTMMYVAYSDPSTVLQSSDYDENDGDIRGSKKYYSTGEGNLTIETSSTNKAKIDKDEEEMTSVSISATYDNYLLTNYSMIAKTSFGNTSYLKMKASYSNSKVKISLPSNYKDFFID